MNPHDALGLNDAARFLGDDSKTFHDFLLTRAGSSQRMKPRRVWVPSLLADFDPPVSRGGGFLASLSLLVGGGLLGTGLTMLMIEWPPSGLAAAALGVGLAAASASPMIRRAARARVHAVESVPHR